MLCASEAALGRLAFVAVAYPERLAVQGAPARGARGEGATADPVDSADPADSADLAVGPDACAAPLAQSRGGAPAAEAPDLRPASEEVRVTSAFRGVSWHKRCGRRRCSVSQPVTACHRLRAQLRPNAPRLRSRKWIAQLMIPAKGGTSACKHLGLYEDEADAARAFDRCGALFLEPSCALGTQRQEGSGALRIFRPAAGRSCSTVARKRGDSTSRSLTPRQREQLTAGASRTRMGGTATKPAPLLRGWRRPLLRGWRRRSARCAF